ncbi:MAG: DNA polymerase III subunit beta [Clostridiales bacterium]|jgi:DNA polymerase-3 subunit beta|nr:DNA polymerase III subunit beta [Clostridiales bacterium]
MKFKCGQKNLSSAISTIQRAISSRITLPILEGFLIEAKENMLRLVGTDLDLITIQTYIPAEIIEEGSAVIPSRVFGDIIRKLPEADITLELQERFQIDIKCQNTFITIQGLDPDEYPEIEQVEGSKPIQIQQDIFKSMIQQSIFAVASDETRPILTGALVEIQNGSISMICLDGYRLALRKEILPEVYDNISMIVPGKALNEISRILTDDETNVTISVGGKHIIFDIGHTKIISRLLEGEFVNYKQIIPQEYKTRVKLDTLLLHQSIERASLMAQELENNLIKLNVQDDRLTITSNSEIGKIYEEIPIVLEGKNIEIAFNARYMLDVLKVTKDQEICLDFTSNVSPCIIRPIEGEAFCYLVLPVRLYG